MWCDGEQINMKYLLTTNQLFHHMVYRYHPKMRIMIFSYKLHTKILMKNALLQDHLLH